MSAFTKFIRPQVEAIREAAVEEGKKEKGTIEPLVVIRLCASLLVEYDLAEEAEERAEEWGKELLKLNKERDRALEALQDAVKVIHDWHNMNTLPTDVDTWKIYYDNSPEMEKVRAVLS